MSETAKTNERNERKKSLTPRMSLEYAFEKQLNGLVLKKVEFLDVPRRNRVALGGQLEQFA